MLVSYFSKSVMISSFQKEKNKDPKQRNIMSCFETSSKKKAELRPYKADKKPFSEKTTVKDPIVLSDDDDFKLERNKRKRKRKGDDNSVDATARKHLKERRGDVKKVVTSVELVKEPLDTAHRCNSDKENCVGETKMEITIDHEMQNESSADNSADAVAKKHLKERSSDIGTPVELVEELPDTAHHCKVYKESCGVETQTKVSNDHEMRNQSSAVSKEVHVLSDDDDDIAISEAVKRRTSRWQNGSVDFNELQNRKCRSESIFCSKPGPKKTPSSSDEANAVANENLNHCLDSIPDAPSIKDGTSNFCEMPTNGNRHCNKLDNTQTNSPSNLCQISSNNANNNDKPYVLAKDRSKDFDEISADKAITYGQPYNVSDLSKINVSCDNIKLTVTDMIQQPSSSSSNLSCTLISNSSESHSFESRNAPVNPVSTETAINATISQSPCVTSQTSDSQSGPFNFDKVTTDKSNVQNKTLGASSSGKARVSGRKTFMVNAKIFRQSSSALGKTARKKDVSLISNNLESDISSNSSEKSNGFLPERGISAVVSKTEVKSLELDKPSFNSSRNSDTKCGLSITKVTTAVSTNETRTQTTETLGQSSNYLHTSSRSKETHLVSNKAECGISDTGSETSRLSSPKVAKKETASLNPPSIFPSESSLKNEIFDMDRASSDKSLKDDTSCDRVCLRTSLDSCDKRPETWVEDTSKQLFYSSADAAASREVLTCNSSNNVHKAEKEPSAALSPGTNAPSDIQGPEGWACSSCTFLNHPELSECEICEQKRPASCNVSRPRRPQTRSVSSRRRLFEEAATETISVKCSRTYLESISTPEIVHNDTERSKNIINLGTNTVNVHNEETFGSADRAANESEYTINRPTTSDGETKKFNQCTAAKFRQTEPCASSYAELILASKVVLSDTNVMTTDAANENLSQNKQHQVSDEMIDHTRTGCISDVPTGSSGFDNSETESVIPAEDVVVAETPHIISETEVVSQCNAACGSRNECNSGATQIGDNIKSNAGVVCGKPGSITQDEGQESIVSFNNKTANRLDCSTPDLVEGEEEAHSSATGMLYHDTEPNAGEICNISAPKSEDVNEKSVVRFDNKLDTHLNCSAPDLFEGDEEMPSSPTGKSHNESELNAGDTCGKGDPDTRNTREKAMTCFDCTSATRLDCSSPDLFEYEQQMLSSPSNPCSSGNAVSCENSRSSTPEDSKSSQNRQSTKQIVADSVDLDLSIGSDKEIDDLLSGLDTDDLFSTQTTSQSSGSQLPRSPPYTSSRKASELCSPTSTQATSTQSSESLQDEEVMDVLLPDDFDEEMKILTSESGESDDEETVLENIDFRFCLSFESDRVYLYDEVSSGLVILSSVRCTAKYSDHSFDVTTK